MSSNPEEVTPSPRESSEDTRGPRAVPNSVASGWIRRIADQWAETQREDQKRQDLSGASPRR